MTENYQERLLNLLNQHFGFNEFRNGQDDVIYSILNGNNTLTVMPTGGGKSLCYQLPAIIYEGLTLVISPLIALMKDQVDALVKVGIPATFINSSLNYSESEYRIRNIIEGNYKIAYIAPERLEVQSFLDKLSMMNISFLAIDEAHCISEWGHDFRPSYLKIPKIFNHINNVPVAAFTATATPEVQKDIVKILNLDKVEKFIRGFDRPNLTYITEEVKDKAIRLRQLCKEVKKGSVIVYCGTRKRVEMYAEDLRNTGLDIEIYHAGLDISIRKITQERFKSGEKRIIIATNAFGMGIDKHDVRKVIHVDIPQTIESYYQEAGRAGRDGEAAECILLYQKGDSKLQEYFIENNHPERKDIEAVYDTLYDINQISIGQRSHSPIYVDNLQIANTAGVTSIKASAAISLLERTGIIKKYSGYTNARIQITATRDQLQDYFESTSEKNRQVLEAIFRSIASEAFYNECDLDINYLSNKYDIPYDDINEALESIQNSRLVEYVPSGAAGGIVLMKDRLTIKSIPVDYKQIDDRRKRAYKKLGQVIHYAETSQCKRNYILHYFSESDITGNCGNCSGCKSHKNRISAKPAPTQELLLKIIEVVATLNERFGKTLLIDFIKGILSPRILSYRLNKLKLFGCGKSASKAEIDELIENAVFDKLLSKSDVYATIGISSTAKALLKDVPEEILLESKRKPDKELLAKLKSLRYDIASHKQISERAIASDIALRSLAAVKPLSKSDLQTIPGIGQAFAENFGNQFLTLIKNETKIDSQENKEIENLPLEVIRAVELFQSGMNIDEISNKMNDSSGNIARYLQMAAENGAMLNISHLASKDMTSQINEIIRKNKTISLQTVRAKIGSDIDYAALRVVVAVLRTKNRV
ncbi:MAG: RecQ family ATP-dependent DNA helicase [Candidatus Kapabacteria bacterium]|nr:RecQ family ATP-dependent DNA helicase [Candidatus Kapabacteria bacterium]